MALRACRSRVNSLQVRPSADRLQFMSLEQLVEQSGLTKQQIIDRSGVSRASLYNWLAGRSAPGDEQCDRLARVFGVEPNEINPLYKFCRWGKHSDPPKIRRGKFMVCALCADEALQKYKPRRAKNVRRVRQERKRRVVDKYGGSCDCCREERLGFLTIDHKNNDGHTERSSGFYRKLDESPKREDLIVMCFNCNCGRAANGGVCPHFGGWPFGPEEDR